MSNKQGVQKSVSGATKRFGKDGRRGPAGKRHGLKNQTSSQRKRKSGPKKVHSVDMPRVSKMTLNFKGSK